MTWEMSLNGDYCDGKARCSDNRCQHCDGYGYLYESYVYPSGVATESGPCPKCEGRGYTDGFTEATYLQGIIKLRDEQIRKLERRVRKQDVMIESLINDPHC